MTYTGDAHLVLSTKVQANPLSASSRGSSEGNGGQDGEDANGGTNSAPVGDAGGGGASPISSRSSSTGYDEDARSVPTSPFGYGQQDDSIWFGAATPSSNPMTASLFPAAATRRGILFAAAPLIVPMKLRLSHLRLRAIIVLIVSKAKGITLVFKNDPLESVSVSSTFDSVGVIAKYLQQEIEGQLREMFRDDLPGIIHRLSQKWLTGGMKPSSNSSAAPTKPSANWEDGRPKIAKSAPVSAGNSVHSDPASGQRRRAGTGGSTSSLSNLPIRSNSVSGARSALSRTQTQPKAASSSGPAVPNGSKASKLPRRMSNKANSSSCTALNSNKRHSIADPRSLASETKGSMDRTNLLRTSSSRSIHSSTTGGSFFSSSRLASPLTTPPVTTPTQTQTERQPQSYFAANPFAESDSYDPTYGLKNEDPIAPSKSFGGLSELVAAKRPALGLKELVSPPLLSPKTDEEEANGDGQAGLDELQDGDAESVDPLESDMDGDEEEELNFYFPHEGDDGPSRHLTGVQEEEEDDDDDDDDDDDEEDEEEIDDEKLGERNTGAKGAPGQDYGDDVDDVPGDFSRFGYPPPDAAFSEVGVGDHSRTATFSSSPRQHLARTAKSSNSSRNAGRRTPPPASVEYETMPAVGGGVIVRPRVLHHGSFAQSPHDADGDGTHSNAGDSTRFGDETVRGAGSVSARMATSTAHSSRTPQTVTPTNPSTPYRSGLGVGAAQSPASGSGDRWTNWGEEEDEDHDTSSTKDDHNRRLPRKSSNLRGEPSYESLTSLVPEPIDTTSYEYRTKEYRERFGFTGPAHWKREQQRSSMPPNGDGEHWEAEATIDSDRSAAGRTGPVPPPLHLPSVDTTARFTHLMHSNHTLSPFTGHKMEHVAVRSAPHTPVWEYPPATSAPASIGTADRSQPWSSQGIRTGTAHGASASRTGDLSGKRSGSISNLPPSSIPRPATAAPHASQSRMPHLPAPAPKARPKRVFKLGSKAS